MEYETSEVNPVEIRNCILPPLSSVSPSLLLLSLLAYPQDGAHVLTCMHAHTLEVKSFKTQERRNRRN